MKPLIILQSRTSSTRLPGKALLPIGGIPLALLCAKRLSRDGLPLILATTEEESNDVLASVAERAGTAVYRGSRDNVLARFVRCTADLDDADAIVRVTADNPVPDAAFVRLLFAEFERTGAEYLGTSSPFDGLPYGLSAEIMRVGTLRKAARNASTAYEKEHVTPYIQRTCSSGHVINGPVVFGIKRADHLRCTIDTFRDYLNVGRVFPELAQEAVEIDWRALVERLRKSPASPKFRVPYREREFAAEGILTLGTVQLGLTYGIANKTGMPSIEDFTKLIDHAIDHGVTWIDTARAYGSAETRIGSALFGGNRDRVRVITKLDPLADLPEEASDGHVSAAVDSSLLRSMRELRAVRLDTVLLHRWSHRQSHGERIWRHLLRRRSEGWVDQLGVSIYGLDEAMAALSDPNIVHVQLPLNILDHRWLADGFCARRGERADVRIHARSVFLQGLLLGSCDIWPGWAEDAASIVERIDQCVVELGRKSRADLCLAFVAAQSWVNSIVVGAETLGQLQDNLELTLRPPLAREECEIVVRHLGCAPTRLLNPGQW